jgi:uncharacterized protein (TIGR00730 family)
MHAAAGAAMLRLMVESAEAEPERASAVNANAVDPNAVVDDVLRALWGAVNSLSKIPDRSGEYRVAIFGSARLDRDDPQYAETRELARRLAARGCTIVTGGGPGLMEAANEGERLGDAKNERINIGIRVDLPFEQGANPFVEEAHLHGTFFSRLHHFVRLSNAFVVVPGGIGTTLEALMVWQLLQVRHITDVPLIFVGPMWRELGEWAKRTMLATKPPLASAKDLEIPFFVDDMGAAAAIIESHVEGFKRRR